MNHCVTPPLTASNKFSVSQIVLSMHLETLYHFLLWCHQAQKIISVFHDCSTSVHWFAQTGAPLHKFLSYCTVITCCLSGHFSPTCTSQAKFSVCLLVIIRSDCQASASWWRNGVILFFHDWGLLSHCFVLTSDKQFLKYLTDSCHHMTHCMWVCSLNCSSLFSEFKNDNLQPKWFQIGSR